MFYPGKQTIILVITGLKPLIRIPAFAKRDAVVIFWFSSLHQNLGRPKLPKSGISFVSSPYLQTQNLIA